MANFLAEATESSGGEYHPTQGVRVLEFESEGEDPDKGTPFKAEVELWDCSGSRRYVLLYKIDSRSYDCLISEREGFFSDQL